MKQKIIAHWNEKVKPLEKLSVPVLDRSFFFGDAVYEVIRVYGGKPFLLTKHMERLNRSLKEILIAADIKKIEKRIKKNLALNKTKDGYIYVQISRGESPRAHSFPPRIKPNVLIYTASFLKDPMEKWRKDGVSLITHEEIRWKRRDIKSVNLLSNCLARSKAETSGCQEALFVEKDGSVTECTSSNIFIVKNSTLITPSTGHEILSGITRGFLIELALKNNIKVEERKLMLSEVMEADEVFIVGTITEILSVVFIDGKPIQKGKPFSITNKLIELFNEQKFL